jgi:hypothetical protein
VEVIDWDSSNTHGLVLAETILELVSVSSDIGLLMPDIVFGGLIDLGQLLLRGTDLVGGLLRGIASNIAGNSDSVVY